MVVITKKIELVQLKSNFKGQTEYRAKTKLYNINIFTDKWQLGTQNNLNLDWMYEAGHDDQTFLDLRIALAIMAGKLAFASLRDTSSFLKLIGINLLSLVKFKFFWLSLTDAQKLGVATTVSRLIKYGNLTQFKDIHNFTQSNRPKQSKTENILDLEKGVYSEVEFDSIKEQLRLATANLPENSMLLDDLRIFSWLMSSQLLIALVRRGCQLNQLKFCDFLPVGQSFSSQRNAKPEWTPVSEYLFSDVECLHIRTFKGKNDAFRIQAERDSHRLEPNFSLLVAKYFKQYELMLMKSLEKQGIFLTDDERKEILMRCPVIPNMELFKINFGTKSNLFKSLGIMSDAFHQNSAYLLQGISQFFTKLDAKSDRVLDKKLELKNNRLRHTMLTLGASMGLSVSYLAKITGVTEQAVRPYIELDFAARVQINQAFADNDVLKRFGATSVENLKRESGFTVVDEFEEEIGIQAKPANCASCESKLGAPLGCYPCDNFRPLDDADHQRYLDKALTKYEFNKIGGNKATVKKLRKVILYINATIKACDEINTTTRGLSHE